MGNHNIENGVKLIPKQCPAGYMVFCRLCIDDYIDQHEFGTLHVYFRAVHVRDIAQVNMGPQPARFMDRDGTPVAADMTHDNFEVGSMELFGFAIVAKPKNKYSRQKLDRKAGYKTRVRRVRDRAWIGLGGRVRRLLLEENKIVHTLAVTYRYSLPHDGIVHVS